MAIAEWNTSRSQTVFVLPLLTVRSSRQGSPSIIRIGQWLVFPLREEEWSKATDSSLPAKLRSVIPQNSPGLAFECPTLLLPLKQKYAGQSDIVCAILYYLGRLVSPSILPKDFRLFEVRSAPGAPEQLTLFSERGPETITSDWCYVPEQMPSLPLGRVSIDMETDLAKRLSSTLSQDPYNRCLKSLCHYLRAHAYDFLLMPFEHSVLNFCAAFEALYELDKTHTPPDEHVAENLIQTLKIPTSDEQRRDAIENWTEAFYELRPAMAHGHPSPTPERALYEEAHHHLSIAEAIFDSAFPRVLLPECLSPLGLFILEDGQTVIDTFLCQREVLRSLLNDFVGKQSIDSLMKDEPWELRSRARKIGYFAMRGNLRVWQKLGRGFLQKVAKSLAHLMIRLLDKYGTTSECKEAAQLFEPAKSKQWLSILRSTKSWGADYASWRKLNKLGFVSYWRAFYMAVTALVYDNQTSAP